jgi:hypothetical protein
LLLDGESLVSCDISNAHWNFMPLILAQRLDFVSRSPERQNYVNDGWREHNRLIALLSDGDFYRTSCVDSENEHERDEKKIILNILLNQKNEKCQQNRLTRESEPRFLSRSESSKTLRATIIGI